MAFAARRMSPSDIKILGVAEDFVAFRGDADLHDGTVLSVHHDGDQARVMSDSPGRIAAPGAS